MNHIVTKTFEGFFFWVSWRSEVLRFGFGALWWFEAFNTGQSDTSNQALGQSRLRLRQKDEQLEYEEMNAAKQRVVPWSASHVWAEWCFPFLNHEEMMHCVDGQVFTTERLWLASNFVGKRKQNPS